MDRDARRARACGATLAGAALCAAVSGAVACRMPFADTMLFSLDKAQLPVAEDCRRCHGEVVAEWSESPHAAAWTSSHFALLTADRSAEPCLGCHAPAPLGRAGEIALRADHREEGVTCISCHLAPEPEAAPLTMRGPHAPTSPLEVHPIAVDELFLKPELCGTCHGDVLDEFRAAPAPADGSAQEICQACHMPAVKRTIESVDPNRPYSRVFVALGSAVEGRRHRFDVPPDPWKHVELETSRAGGRWVVVVHNRMPHGLPTGAFGRREARLRAGTAAVLLREDLDQAIPAGGSRRFELEAGAESEVVLERRNPRTGEYERLAPAPPGPPR